MRLPLIPGKKSAPDRVHWQKHRQSIRPQEEIVVDSQRIGLVVIHGIGQQPAGELRKSVVEGLRRAYPKAEIELDGDAVTGFPRDLRIYEVHWADLLPLDKVKGSFKMEAVDQFAWFPLLNRRGRKDHRNSYPRRLVWSWTLALVPLAVLAKAAHFGADLLVRLLRPYALASSAMLAGLRQWRMPDWSWVQQEWERGKADRDSFLQTTLDGTVADVFNYVNSAAGVEDAPVPDAAGNIHARFAGVLRRAILEGGCSEIQILAHSLGSLIAYRALTVHAQDTRDILAFPTQDAAPASARLTRIYTLGSPLEKIRFFWPKLVPFYEGQLRTVAGAAWDNFISRFDPIAGVLQKRKLFPDIENHRLKGTGGLVTAHTGYWSDLDFLKILGENFTGEPVETRLAPGRRRNVLEWLVVPAIPLVVAAGLGLALFGGWLFSTIIGSAVYYPAEGLRWAMSATWTAHSQVYEWIRWLFGWPFLVVLFVLPVVLGLVKASDVHRRYWKPGDALPGPEESHEVPEKMEREGRMQMAKASSVAKGPGRWWHVLGSVVLLVAMVWAGMRAGVEDRARGWVMILVLMTVFALLNGQGATGLFRGILIDARNRMSLSRLQMLAWTLLVLSALLAGFLANVAAGAESPMEIAIPSQLWVLLGISTASAVGAPAVLNNKRSKRANRKERDKSVAAMMKAGAKEPDLEEDSIVLRNKSIEDARWGELLKGDESGNASAVDLGKLQLFFFTFILVAGYGAALYNMFLTQEGPITALPPVEEGMNVLLGISHTGYLANKAVTYSKEAETEEGAAPAGAEGTKS
jgi:hypothetical protein